LFNRKNNENVLFWNVMSDWVVGRYAFERNSQGPNKNIRHVWNKRRQVILDGPFDRSFCH